MSKNVCMFVWNHFTNDARVLRECTALSENGYHVDLICIHDPKDPNLPMYEERNEHFHIYRVKRYPDSLLKLQRMYRKMKRKKSNLLVTILVGLIAFYFVPILTILVFLGMFAVLKTKVKGLVIKGSIILRMVAKGRNRKYDIYHSNDLNTLPQGVMSAKLRLKKRKLIYDSHEVQTDRTGYNPNTIKRVEKFLLRFIDQMIVENHTRAAFNEQLYGFYPEVLHNYPFLQSSHQHEEKVNLHEMLNLPEEEKILLYQGGIQVGRGLDKIVKAVPMIEEGTVVFIGDGKKKEELIQLVKELKIEDRVKFMPKVPVEDLPKYTKCAYLGFQVLNNICFNHYSASSNKLFEYMMAGVPVIACSFPEIQKVVETNDTGICVDSHDPKSIAAGVNKLVKDPTLREQLSKNSLNASGKYNWEEEKVYLLTIYDSFFENNDLLVEV